MGPLSTLVGFCGAFILLGSYGDSSAPGEVRAKGMLVGAAMVVLGVLGYMSIG